MIYPVITPKTRQLPLYVTGIGIKGHKENINRPNGYNYNQISFITQGEGVFLCGKDKYDLKKGSCFYFSRDIPHSYYSTNKRFINKWVCFDGDNLSGLTDLIDKNGYCVFDVHDCDSFISAFDRIYSLIKRNDEFSQEMASAVLYQLIIDFIKIKNKSTLYNTKNQMQSVLEYIEKNYDSAISLEQIASSAGMSKYSLCKVFKDTFGITVFTYLAKIRIKQAKALLVNDININIKDIALSVGFNDASYFISAFKKHENCTPLEFRRIWCNS